MFKRLLFTLVFVGLFFSAQSSEAGVVLINGDGNIISAVSDCKEVRVEYGIGEVGDPGWVIVAISNIDSNVVDIADEEGWGIARISLQANPGDDIVPGSEIVVIIGNVGPVDIAYVSCDPELILFPEDNYINDGRLEPFAGDRVIYARGDGISVYSPDGEFLLFIPYDTIEMLGIPTDEPRLLGETADGYVHVWRLSDGRYEVQVGPDAGGKIHGVRWSGLVGISPGAIETYTIP